MCAVAAFTMAPDQLVTADSYAQFTGLSLLCDPRISWEDLALFITKYIDCLCCSGIFPVGGLNQPVVSFMLVHAQNGFD